MKGTVHFTRNPNIKLLALSRREIEAYNPIEVPHLLVSITTPGDPLATVVTNQHTLKVERFVFHDLDKDPGPMSRQNYGEPTLFTRESAVRLLDSLFTFCPDGVLAHCDAGASRSVAVVAAIARYCGGRELEYQVVGAGGMYSEHRNSYVGNRLVYSTLLSVLEEGK